MNEHALSPKRNALEAMKRSIILMEIGPGTVLEEADLCERFGISRTPLREVVRDLAAYGYVTLTEKKSARVSDLSYETVRAFFLAAPMIYCAVLRLAAENATSSQIDELEGAQAEFRAALEEGHTVSRTLANDRFHRITGDMAGNPYILSSFHRLLIDHARIGMTFFKIRRPGDDNTHEKAALQHDSMLDAIKRRDTGAAGKLALDHWSLSRSQIEAFVMPDSLESELGTLPRREPAIE